jgi:hypothetical protein
MLDITTPEQQDEIVHIIREMKNNNLDKDFIGDVGSIARYDQNVFNLMDMWFKNEFNNREDIEEELQEIVDASIWKHM